MLGAAMRPILTRYFFLICFVGTIFLNARSNFFPVSSASAFFAASMKRADWLAFAFLDRFIASEGPLESLDIF
jgi:hypothetical protein